ELAKVAHPPAPGVVLGSAPSDSDPFGHRDRGQIHDALGPHRFGRLRFALDPASGVEQSDPRHQQDNDNARVWSHLRFSWASRRRTVAGLGPPITRRRRNDVSADSRRLIAPACVPQWRRNSSSDNSSIRLPAAIASLTNAPTVSWA